MSNALARKKKRMQPLGYSKSELIGIQRHASAPQCLIRTVS